MSSFTEINKAPQNVGLVISGTALSVERRNAECQTGSGLGLMFGIPGVRHVRHSGIWHFGRYCYCT